MQQRRCKDVIQDKEELLPLHQGQRLPHSPGVNIEKAVELRLKGLTYQEIGDYFCVTKQAIQYHLGGLTADELSLKAYKDNRADLLAMKQTELLKTLTPEEIKKIPPGSRVTCMGILYDKEAIERGHSDPKSGVVNIQINFQGKDDK